MSVETHEFEVAPSIIMHLILSQAGSCGKALLECVMNSVDASASKVDILLDHTSVSIADNGHGLRSREEILAVFKQFGFDHSSHHRQFGRFGLGRGQLWAFASTVWRTHGFALDVNVKARGLKWDLQQGLPHHEGLLIEGKFYEPLSNVDLTDLINDLERLCRYAQVPVFVNGRQISKETSGQKWTIETDEAYLKVTDGSYLSVYNQGLYTCDVYAGSTGVSGVLVTKPGHNLTMNIARNDVQRDCLLWKKLNELMRKEAGKRKQKESTRLTDADRAFLARQTSDPKHLDNFKVPLFTLSTGRHINLHTLLTRLRSMPLTVSETGNRVAETLNRDKLALVLSQDTLNRFGVATLTDLIIVLNERVYPAAAPQGYGAREEIGTTFHLIRLLAPGLIKVYENLAECPGYKQMNYSRVPKEELSPRLRRFLQELHTLNTMVASLVASHTNRPMSKRELMIGRSEHAEAYTDGTSFVAIVDTTAEQAIKDGFAGWIRIAHLLVHEYLHDTEDSGSHAHDLQFMTDFHDITLDAGVRLMPIVLSTYQRFLKAQERLSRTGAKELDRLEAIAA